ncbi:MAG: glycosyltransferase family 2 protein [Rugosibacter sp.]|nr:glycosyltransferase family 2 protein [Rugosibacter sp.]
MTQTPLSAVFITQDAAATLSAALASVAFCDEVLVVDSGSTDNTLAIAASHGARVISTHWRGFGAQKQFAVENAKHDWVLCIDSDERVSDCLREHLIAAVSPAPTNTDNKPCAYRFARCNRFMGRYLRHGEGYPDWSLRCFNRQHAHWSNDTVHEKVCLADNSDKHSLGTLHGDLLHDSAESIEKYLEKQNRYSTLAANTAFAQGKRAHAGHLVLSPLIRFIKFYFFRFGCLDGLPGLVHILIGCGASFAKYAKLAALQRQAESPPLSSTPTE